ncbi:MAG: hypothetical protein GWO11_00425 [Desulfuromonadales bacterium]|nr:hypothetical protein [Desulfuromonadales bacterium]NIR32992.1 hypothetical protein [Desulfuromonadales bacterium]NIS40330.1 hypothetical protein [Desulfuromonadales bacterium]
MRKFLSWALVLIATFFLTGMGGIGGQPTGKTPETPEDIGARLVDRQGNAVDLTQLSMDGNVFVKGDVGSGNLTVPMAKIKKLTFGPVRGEFVPVTVLMKTGEQVELRMSKRADFYGNMGVGAYRVEASKVREISLR